MHKTDAVAMLQCWIENFYPKGILNSLRHGVYGLFRLYSTCDICGTEDTSCCCDVTQRVTDLTQRDSKHEIAKRQAVNSIIILPRHFATEKFFFLFIIISSMRNWFHNSNFLSYKFLLRDNETTSVFGLLFAKSSNEAPYSGVQNVLYLNPQHQGEDLLKVSLALMSTVNQPPQSYIWKGNICVKGLRSALVVPCVAIPHNDASGLPPMTRNTSSWPSELMCDSANLKSAADVSGEVNQSRLYVRFVPVDAYGKEKADDKLESLAAMLMERALLFEVPCLQSESRGSLFLWSTHTSLGRYSMYGGFKPYLPS